MKLWVDDIRNAPDETWTVARTVTSAIRALSMFEFDEISLDHDISHQLTMGSLGRPYPCDETFMAVAYYIALKYGWEVKPGSPILPMIYIHSSNVVAGEEMKRMLEDAGANRVELKPMGLANRLEQEVP